MFKLLRTDYDIIVVVVVIFIIIILMYSFFKKNSEEVEKVASWTSLIPYHVSVLVFWLDNIFKAMVWMCLLNNLQVSCTKVQNWVN